MAKIEYESRIRERVFDEKEFHINPQKKYIVIGRNGFDPNVEIVLLDAGVSRYHSTIFESAGTYYLADHSTNGTLYQNTELQKMGESILIKSTGTVSIKTGDLEETIKVNNSISSISSEKIKKIIQKQDKPNFKPYPKIQNYKPHQFATTKDFEELLAFLETEPKRKELASTSHPLTQESSFVIFGEEETNFLFRFFYH